MLPGRQAFVCRSVLGKIGIPTLGQLATQHPFKQGRFAGVLAAIGSKGGVPVRFSSLATSKGLTPMVVGLLGHFKGAIAPFERLAGQFGFVCSQGCTMDSSRVGFVG